MLKRIADLKLFIRKRGKRQFCKEVLIALILLSMPFWFRMRLYSSDTLEIFGILLHKGIFADIGLMIWAYTLKIIPIIVLFIWIFNNRFWWKFTLFVPLIFAVIQLIELAITERYFDENEFLYAFLLSLPLIFLTLWLLNKINAFNENYILNKAIQCEIEHELDLFRKNRVDSFKELRNEFSLLKKQKYLKNEDEYIYLLITFRNRIISQQDSF